MNVVSLFSGCGGLDLGFINAGFNVLWANDIVPEAVNTYRKNIGNHIHLGDISKIDLAEVPKADILVGGPPCQAFSLAGLRDPNDARANLIWEYIRLLKHVEPRAFLFENVIGLKSAKDETGNLVIEELRKAFKDIGYNISWEIVNTANYGIPQRRKRIFIVGTKSEVPFEFPTPTHNEEGNNGLLRWVSCIEAIGDLPLIQDGIEKTTYRTDPSSKYQSYMRTTSEEVNLHNFQTISAFEKQIIPCIPIGGNYMSIPVDIATPRILRLQETGGRTTLYGRLHPDKPSFTISTYFNRITGGCHIHYEEDRIMSIREAMRFQSFPDNFRLFAKSKRAQHTMIGNAVPPLMAEVFAKHLYTYLAQNT